MVENFFQVIIWFKGPESQDVQDFIKLVAFRSSKFIWKYYEKNIYFLKVLKVKNLKILLCGGAFWSTQAVMEALLVVHYCCIVYRYKYMPPRGHEP